MSIMRRVRARMVVAGFMLTPSACGEPPRSLPAPRWHGDRVSLATLDGQPPCAGTVEYMDAYLQSLGDVGIPISPDLQVEYQWLPLAMEQSDCAPHQEACTIGETIYAPILADEHELVHAAVISAWGRTTGLFEEGLAEALGSSRSAPYAVQADAFHPEQLLEGPLNLAYYDAAGAFVRLLIDRHGMADLAEFYQATPMDADAAFVRERFEQVFEESLEGFSDAFFAQQSHCTYEYPRCFGPQVPWQTEQRWTWGSQMQCDRGHLQGPLGTYGDPAGVYRKRRVRNRVVVDVDESGQYAIHVDGPTPRMQRCGPCGERLQVWLPEDQSRLVWLPTGRYWIESNQPVGEAEPFSLMIEQIELDRP